MKENITQHIPDKSFQLVRYYGWYSNKMRGQRKKRAEEKVEDLEDGVEVINVSKHQPRRIPSQPRNRLPHLQREKRFPIHSVQPQLVP